MNDFTKEELKILYMCTMFVTESTYSNKIYDELMKKIRSMIDNYCEHEWINATYCEKCNKNLDL